MDTQQLLIENPSYRAWWFLARGYHSMAAVATRFFDERGISGAQFGVLRCVADAGQAGLMLSDLSRLLMVTSGNITGVVDRMEQAGYIRRHRHRSDRRVILARLTPAGRALYEEVMPAFLEMVRDAFSDLSPEEMGDLSSACQALHLALEERKQPDPMEPALAAAGK